jgi:hypothetical protein
MPSGDTDNPGCLKTFWLLFLGLVYLPYRILLAAIRFTWAERNELISRTYEIALENDGHPVPNPILPADEMRRQFLEYLPNPDKRVSDVELFALESALAMAHRLTGVTTLVVAGAILVGSGIACWQYVLPWVSEQVRNDPIRGGTIAVSAFAIAWTLTGWIAVGFVSVAIWFGPTSWFGKRAGRKLRSVFGEEGEHPSE